MLKEGIIVKAISNKYEVECEEKIYLCNARGILKLQEITPMVGDRVLVSGIEEGDALIEKVYTRKNQFIRPVISNLDQLVIILSVRDPMPDLLMLDKQIIYCLYNNVRPIICINKTDLDEVKADKIKEIYERIGYRVIATNTINKENIAELKDELLGKITAFSGNSGVGKSSILNTIFGEIKNVQGDISQKLGRGKHTTRHTELFKIDNNTYIADTPGFSSLELLLDIKSDELREYYTEFDMNDECAFLDCRHINESKCSVKEKVRNNEISKTRYNNYLNIYNELKEKEERKYK